MPDPSQTQYTAPEYTGPGLAQNLPVAPVLPQPAPQVPLNQVPLAPGVEPVVVSEPWSIGKRLAFAGLMLLCAAGMGWFTVWSPLDEARHGQVPTYYFKGILLTSTLLYVALIALFADLRDHKLRLIGPNGKGKLTRRGWIIGIGAIVAMIVGIFAFNFAMGLYGYSIF